MAERSGQSFQASGTSFDLVLSRLRRPVTRPGAVHRSSLLEMLVRDDLPPIISVVAPAGYGKTTLLSQWAERAGHAVAWVTLDAQDNDPKVLLTYIARALDAVEPIAAPVFDALGSPASSVPGSVVPRLASAFGSMTGPVALVLDDVHLLRNRECRSAVSVLAEHVPKGSRLALSSRNRPPLRMARLRRDGRILEIGPADLALSREEAEWLLRDAGLALGDDEVAELHRRTEGWPAGLYLAALYLREGGALPDAVVSFRGDDRLVSEYVESEFLARMSRRRRMFLTRTAVLQRMSGPLCEAVLELPGAAADLTELARSNSLLVPLDHGGGWYRYHHLFRDMLLAELDRTEPGLAPVLRQRAAGWCVRSGLPEEALEYSMAAGNADMAAELVARLAVPAQRQGRVSTLLRWFGWLDDRGEIERHPIVTVLAAMLYTWLARPVEAERLADVVDRWRDGNARQLADPAVSAWAALGRAFMCRHGITQMLADADEASRAFPRMGIVTPGPALMQGIARILSGDPDGGGAALTEAVSLGEQAGAHEIAAEALGERALLAIGRGDWGQGERLAGEAAVTMRQAGIAESPGMPLVCAAQARVAIHRGDVQAARQQLISAQRSRPLLTYAMPHMSVQARIELTRVHLALADMTGARTLLGEIDELLSRRPGLGTLVAETRELRGRLPEDRGPAAPGASSLTAAELRVLPMLATHLSFPEIAAEMFLSPHTVKSQAISIYRKLGARSRNQAVARSRELGLLEG